VTNLVAKTFLYDKIFNTFERDAECVRILGTAERAQHLAEEGTGWEASNVPVFILDVCTISQPAALQRSWNCSSGP
jgi:hypothetical protein